MKIAVIGSRNFKDKNLLKTVLDAETQITELITGGAVGADTMAENWAKENDCKTIELNSYVQNSKSHKFYYNLGYAILGFHFQKKIG